MKTFKVKKLNEIVKDEALIDLIHDLLKDEITVYEGNEAYQFLRSPVNCKYQEDHFSTRGGFVLTARCISNYFGGVISESCPNKAFIKVEVLNEK